MDDEAPGPGDVGEALAIAREVFGRRRLLAVYYPAVAASRRPPDPGEFAAADQIWIVGRASQAADPMAAGLVEGLIGGGIAARWMAGVDDAIRELDRFLEPGDVLVTLGADEVGTIADAFLRRLSGDHHS